MGGLMFIIGVVAAIAVSFAILPGAQLYYAFSALLLSLSYGFIGFIDDYVKIRQKRNQGLTTMQKLVLQILVAIVFLYTLSIMGRLSTIVTVPFWLSFDLGVLYYPFAAVLIVGFVNAVNLTDGVDGLASSVTLIAASSFLVIFGIHSIAEGSLLSAALAGGCLGFLVWNIPPAKIFMGDTGSMFLGGLVVSLAFLCGHPMLIFFIGIVYLLEAASVIMQVLYFKLTKGKRIFKMTPIHHHFEMSGYSESSIVLLFTAVTIIGGIVAVLSVR
jgi:phospho-N-acetylmuramoyl-pentapeptide-transferase